MLFEHFLKKKTASKNLYNMNFQILVCIKTQWSKKKFFPPHPPKNFQQWQSEDSRTESHRLKFLRGARGEEIHLIQNPHFFAKSDVQNLAFLTIDSLCIWPPKNLKNEVSMTLKFWWIWWSNLLCLIYSTHHRSRPKNTSIFLD